MSCMLPYTATQAFAIGEHLDISIIQKGETLAFDGAHIELRGRTYHYPALAGAVECGWLERSVYRPTAWEHLLNDEIL